VYLDGKVAFLNRITGMERMNRMNGLDGVGDRGFDERTAAKIVHSQFGAEEIAIATWSCDRSFCDAVKSETRKP
jgi:hypothetical protein